MKKYYGKINNGEQIKVGEYLEDLYNEMIEKEFYFYVEKGYELPSFDVNGKMSAKEFFEENMNNEYTDSYDDVTYYVEDNYNKKIDDLTEEEIKEYQDEMYELNKNEYIRVLKEYEKYLKKNTI